MTIRMRTGGRDLAPELIRTLDQWTERNPVSPGLHSGDIGWHLRLPDDALAGHFRVWMEEDRPVAVGLAEPPVLRVDTAPDRYVDPLLAETIGADLGGIDYVDTFSGSALRTHLVLRGWCTDPDPWVTFYRELRADDPPETSESIRPLAGRPDVEARTAVQRSAFAPGSTFWPDYWERMAAGPSYDPRFEMVAWTSDGDPAAAATGWFAGSGRCALLEPVGTHADQRRQGHGRRVNLAVMAALAAAGASGVRVHTPAANTGAVAAYESCGLRQVDLTTAVRRPA